MKTEFRNRAFLPLVLPLGILGGVLAIVALFALVLLYNTREAALALATVTAAGILVAVALAASQDHLERKHKAVIGGAVAVPLLLGVVLALGVIAVPEADLNINREPVLVIPEDAPVIAAENNQNFCAPADGGCEPTEMLAIPIPADGQPVFVFDNQDTATGPHNVGLYALAGSESAPEAGEAIFNGAIFAGPAEMPYFVEAEVEPGQFFFQCDVHPNMQGVGEFVPEGEGGEAPAPSEGGEGA